MSTTTTLSEPFPYLIFDSPAAALELMLNDIHADLGPEAVSILKKAKVYGRVIAVFLEYLCTTETPSFMEAVAIAGAEAEVAAVIRARALIAFDTSALDGIVDHALPAMRPAHVRRVRAERRAA